MEYFEKSNVSVGGSRKGVFRSASFQARIRYHLQPLEGYQRKKRRETGKSCRHRGGGSGWSPERTRSWPRRRGALGTLEGHLLSCESTGLFQRVAPRRCHRGILARARGLVLPHLLLHQLLPQDLCLFHLGLSLPPASEHKGCLLRSDLRGLSPRLP